MSGMLRRVGFIALFAFLPGMLLAQQPDSTKEERQGGASELLRKMASALETAADMMEEDSTDGRDPEEDEHDWPTRGTDFVGVRARESAFYRRIPAWRYNRVEGLVLGIERDPLAWGDDRRAKITGQLGYAFALDRWRYDAGLEVRLRTKRDVPFATKVGFSYRRNTATNDAWKLGWLENSLAAFLFKNDFFDYYEVEGTSVYAVQRLTPLAALSVGYRAEEYHPLRRETGWALFGGDGFRTNPFVREGTMHSLVATLEAEQVMERRALRRGAAFQGTAEVGGEGLGGSFAFNRFEAEGRLYHLLTAFSALNLRLRGGLATGDVPPQKRFTLGGLGSVRGYPQNAYAGRRMLLANAAYVYHDPDLLDGDVLLMGLFDAGWVNAPGTVRFDRDDVLAAAGIGLAATNTALRFELMWPLRDAPGSGPTLWLRLGK